MKLYTFHITLFDAAFFGALFIGLTFILLLCFSNRENRSANRFLTMALGVAFLWIARILAIDIHLAVFVPFWSRLPMQFSLAFGPLLYFYVLKIARPEYKFGRKDWLHLSPLLLEFVAFALGVRESIITGTETYDTEILHRLNPVLQLLAFISVISYLFQCHRLIENYYKQLKFNGGDRYRLELRWLDNLLAGFGLVWLLWIPVAIFSAGLQITCFMYLLLFSMMIWMAAKAFLRPEASEINNPPVFLKPTMPAELKQKGAWLKNVVKENRCYEDPELSLGSLAIKLELTTHELSRIINTALKKSFNDFINEFRVWAVTRKMQDPAYDHITLLGIAFESGFNSQSTFTRIFKQVTGKSPLEYKNDLKKDYPSYKLGSHPGFAEVISNQKSNRNFMFKNYFKTAWRNLTRNKSYAAINITGLAIGIAACLLIFLVVQYETSFDNFHTNRERIYRVVNVTHGPDGVKMGGGTQVPLADGLKLDFPQLKNVGSIMLNDGTHYSIAGSTVKKFKEDSAYYADPQFFQIFNFKWLAGDKKTALAEPNAMVLSRAEADRFFGDWNTAMGKTVKYENKRDFKVTGIIENTPANTDFPMRLLLSWTTLVSKGGDLNGNVQDWISTFSDRNTYLILPAGITEKQFNADLVAFAKKHIPPPYNKTNSLQLQPLTDMHYDTSVGVYGGHPFSKQLINVISLIGLFLLIIACVNFVNLATAQAINRSKEVGIRKVLGSNRYQLVLQFISETLIITLFAVILASVISMIALPLLNDLLEIHLSGDFLLNTLVLLFLIGVVVGVTLLAGFYPALVLSGFNPIEALKNKIKAGRSSGVSLRRVLVVTQFCIAQFLVIGTLVLIYQMNYFKNKSLGFNKDAVITVPFPGDSVSETRINALKEQLLQQPGIKDVSISLYGPAENSGWFSDFRFDNAPKAVDFNSSLKWADPEYFKLYDIRFVAGGPYKNTDTISGYVVNETLIHKLGITDPKQAIGKYIMLWGVPKLNARITGVVKDFNAGSLRKAIPPVLMGPWKDHYSKFNIKIQSKDVHQTLAGIEGLWNKTFPDGIYEYQFLDKTIADFYKSEDELASLYKIFAGIAIFISCLGLYGLVSFMAVQRIKEVGIRKTLGASVGDIVYLFSKEFTVLIVIAFAISAPLGYYFMHAWLEDFTYRITIGPGIFILAIITSVFIAWITVGYKSVRAALTNPVKSLRSE
ncbi:ABC transporter permease [Mucilaginibacter sp. BJC16-A38]|uniref:ABC transporter permease n=1 Tax=Mucilaginibacter phenanthrenivorans TaxID=1234842 RepID=UPI00215816CA|nr:ABC transporter permease [Mucilaginibacter phenanthrenivorans]MCR8556410.1 ABC transporter permease [Mucilaginibacter phenanthrenivorans]